MIPTWTGNTWQTASTADDWLDNVTTSGSTYRVTVPSVVRTYFSNSTANTTTQSTGSISSIPVWDAIRSVRDHLKIDAGEACRIDLPDGTAIDVKADGSFTIEDKDAKVIYRASRIRDFNPFINVSDRIEEFIAFCGAQGVRKGEMLELPLSLFIGWLVIQAAKADQEPEPAVPLLPDLRKRITPRCPGSGRITLADMRVRKIEFCAPPCFERHYRRHVLAIQ